MDIEINEVQEIIKTLESGGELSIKEEKYLKTAKLCVQLAEENVALKEDRGTLARYWIEDGGDKDCAMSYCEPTTATDRIVAGIKADGVEEFAAHLLSMECHLEATWAKSFVSEVLNVKCR